MILMLVPLLAVFIMCYAKNVIKSVIKKILFANDVKQAENMCYLCINICSICLSVCLTQILLRSQANNLGK